VKFDDSINILNEGLWDKTKARAAGAVGAVKGVGDRLAGSAIGAIGGATNNQAAIQAGQAQKQRGQARGQVSKIESYKKSAFNKINKLSEEIFKDLKDLGIDLKGTNPNAANGFIGQLNKGFNDLIANVNAGGAGTNPTPAAASAPAAPATRIVPRASAPASPSAAAPASAPSTPAPASTPTATTPASTPTPTGPASTKTALDRGTAPTPGASAPMSDEQIVADLNAKKADSYKDNNSLIMLAKQRAGETGVGSKTGAPKDGVELLKTDLDPADPITQAKNALAKQYNIDPKKLVDLMSQVYTESKSVRRFSLTFNDLINKL